MTTHAPAGWYPDPHDGAGQRYWDGSAWTSHVAPASPSPGQAPARSGRSTGWIIAIVAGVLVLVVGVGLLAAIAIPLFLQQQEKARDASARADAASIGVALSEALVDSPDETPTVEVSADGSAYVIRGSAGELARAGRSEGVVLERAIVDVDGLWLCVQTRAEGSSQSAHYDPGTGPAEGPCP